jgi:hypothetical protein
MSLSKSEQRYTSCVQGAAAGVGADAGADADPLRYLQSQNLMHVPTYILFIVAPLNLVFNWLLVRRTGPSARGRFERYLIGFRFGALTPSDWDSPAAHWPLL